MRRCKAHTTVCSAARTGAAGSAARTADRFLCTSVTFQVTDGNLRTDYTKANLTTVFIPVIGTGFLFLNAACPGLVISRVTAPSGTFGRAVGIVGRAVSVGRHRNRRSVPTVVGITGLALGRTVAPIGLAAVRTAVIAPVPAVVAVSGLAF